MIKIKLIRHIYHTCQIIALNSNRIKNFFNLYKNLSYFLKRLFYLTDYAEHEKSTLFANKTYIHKDFMAFFTKYFYMIFTIFKFLYNKHTTIVFRKRKPLVCRACKSIDTLFY